MSVVWDFIKSIYDEIYDIIDSFESDFFKGLSFIILWCGIISLIMGILLLSIPLSPVYSNKWIGLGVIIAVIFIELVSFVGMGIFGESN